MVKVTPEIYTCMSISVSLIHKFVQCECDSGRTPGNNFIKHC